MRNHRNTALILHYSLYQQQIETLLHSFFIIFI